MHDAHEPIEIDTEYEIIDGVTLIQNPDIEKLNF